jgi:acyl-CoA dehydrogenase
VIQAMDIVGGAGISKGPANFIQSAYIGIPIAITVEGANALTRSLIIFGQVRPGAGPAASRALACPHQLARLIYRNHGQL